MKIKALLFIIFAGLLWGTSPLFSHFLKGYGYTPLQMTAVRSVVSALVLGIFILIRNRSLFKANLKELLLFFACGISYLCTATFYFSSMDLTSAATGVVLMYTAPVYVTVFSVAFLGERITKMKFISIAAMLVGCVLVAGIVGGFKSDLIGILFGVLSGISYAAYNIITKITMRRGSDPVSLTFYTFLFAALVSSIISEPVAIVKNTAANPGLLIPMLALLGIVTCVSPYFLYTLAMRELSAGTAASLGIIEPMAATVFSAIFLSEIPDKFQIIGIVLILAATVLLSYAESRVNAEKTKN